ncbi:MAG: alpha/beta hydrolase [Gammaproteobacteria bacterium]|nr:alpha/beta hydrolase [Gammaproteobacteria bacterium]
MIDPTLEYQYNVRAAVPEHSDYFSRWQTLSEAFREQRIGYLDQQYGTGPRQSLDLFPAGGTRLHLFLHGGYWQAMDKSFFSFLAGGLIEHGIDVAICNYPLCPHADLSVIVDSVRLACRFLWRNAARFQGRWNSIQLSGHSAGGHLVSMLMATRWPELDSALPGGLIGSGVSISGLYDLEPLRYTSINDKLGLDAAAARAISPLQVPAATRAPMLLVTGNDERPAFREQMFRFAERRRRERVPVETLCLDEKNHFSVLEELTDSRGILLEKVLAMA